MLQDYNREVLQTVTIPNVTANWEAWRFRSSAPQLQQPQQAQQPQQEAAAAPAGQQADDAAPGPAPGAPPARYFSGDWGALGAALAARGLAAGYDVVLSAETIYSLDSMRSLYACIRQASGLCCKRTCAGLFLLRPRLAGCAHSACGYPACPLRPYISAPPTPGRGTPLARLVQCLRRPGGVAYIAAKSYYFGVGGGTTAFVQLVEGEGEMLAEVVQVLDDGLSNKREILRLGFLS